METRSNSDQLSGYEKWLTPEKSFIDQLILGLTFLQGLVGLRLPSLPLQPLALLQTLLLDVGFVPQARLHQPLVRSQAAVGGRDALF